MDKFKVGDKVVAPTVFNGVGEVINVSIDTVKVKDTNDVCYNFTTCGKVSIYAELPALHHYKEPNTKLSFLEAMQALQEGFIVQTPSTPKIVFLLDCENDIVFTGTDNILNGAILDSSLCYCTDFIKENVQDTNWSIYNEKEQETVEWTPKKYESVLYRDTYTDQWVLDYFLRMTYRTKAYPYKTVYGERSICIPFNESTEHLLGTTDEPKVKYVIKEANNG